MTTHHLVVQLTRTFIRPHDFPEVYATIGSGLYVGRTDASTPPAVALARSTVDTWNLATVGSFNPLHDQADKYVTYRDLDTSYGVLDVLAACDPYHNMQAAYVTVSIDPSRPTATNPVTYTRHPALTDSLIRTWSEDLDAAHDISQIAAGDSVSSVVFRKDFFAAGMEPVDTVPAGFRPNTTTVGDAVFTMCPPRVGVDFTFDTALATTIHTATVRNDL